MAGRIARHNRRYRRSLQLESLERREVFSSDLAFVDHAVQTPRIAGLSPVSQTDHSSLAKRFFAARLYQGVTPSDTLTQFATEAELDAKLRELVSQYWDGLLGKTPGEANANVPNSGLVAQPELLQNEIYWVTADAHQPNQMNGRLVNQPHTRSITNNQHGPIDEGDTAETTADGYLYLVLDNAIHVVDLRNPSAPVTSRVLELESYNAQLFVSGDELIVVQSWFLPDTDEHNPIHLEHSSVSVYDISQRTAPARQSIHYLDGGNLAARLRQGVLTLVQDNTVKLPDPRLITDANGIERFETLDSYLAANRQGVLAALLPNFGPAGSHTDVGTWRDLSMANNSLNRATSVLQLKTVDGALSVISSETVVGWATSLVYQGLDDIYLVSNATPDGDALRTFITRIDATADGELAIVGVAGITGQIRSANWMNEHQGILQVASWGQSTTVLSRPIWESPTSSPTAGFVRLNISGGANITTLGSTPSGWGVLGSRENIADAQGLLSASFFDNLAVLTTGATEIIAPSNALHVFDLSDPAHPKQLSELYLPDFTTYLMQIDTNHWLGFGYPSSQDSLMQSNLQISLYDMSDLAKPQVLDRWVRQGYGWFGNIEPNWISYDPATGFLTMKANLNDTNGHNLNVGVLKIDLHAEDKLTWLGEPALGAPLLRSFTLGNHYVTLTDHVVRTFDVSQMSRPLGTAFLQNDQGLIDDYVAFPTGTRTVWRIKDTWKGEPYTIVDVKVDGELTVKLNDDQSISVRVPKFVSGSTGKLTLTVQFASGRIKTFESPVRLDHMEPKYTQEKAAIQAAFTNDAREVVTQFRPGDEVWVTVSALDLRDVPGGVFGAYMDVSFNSANFTVIGTPEHLGSYTNGTSGKVTQTEIRALGGFGGSTPPGVAKADIARFKIRVHDDRPVTLTFSPSRELGSEFLVHGPSKPVDPANIPDLVLTSAPDIMRTLTATTDPQDVNNDGVVTALDVLQLINYINSRNAASNGGTSSDPQPSNFDLTNDGVISALDVLQVVNTINARSQTASGEGPVLSPTAVDQAVSLDFEELRRKSGAAMRLVRPT